MRIVFANTLVELAAKDERICFITPDMGYSIIDDFQNTFPERYFNLGIAEQNVIAVAAGMALAGFKPYVYSVIPFIVHRCLEQIRVNVAYAKTDVKIIGIGSGFEYGSAGATHYGMEDISIMRSLPDMDVYAPGDMREMAEITKLTAQNDRPSYIRIGRHNHADMNKDKTFTLGKASFIEKGKDIAFIATGNMVHIAKDYADQLKQKGIYPSVVSMHTLKPFDAECLRSLAKTHKRFFTFEEHTIIGGLGSAVAEVLAESGKDVKLKRIGINDEFSRLVGNTPYIRHQYKLDLNGVAELCGL